MARALKMLSKMVQEQISKHRGLVPESATEGASVETYDEAAVELNQLTQERAYLKLQSRHSNTVISQEETDRIWLEAEKEIMEEEGSSIFE